MRRFHAVACSVSIAIALAAGSAAAQVSVVVDPTADMHPINPLIYGLNFASDAQITSGGITLTRWGGNSTTRYNYEIDVHNSAADYFYENIPGCWSGAAGWCGSPPTDPKEQSGANQFLSGADSHGITQLFTIPTIGWTPKPPPKYGHPFDCGCPVNAVGAQNSTDPYDTNCGDGFAPGSTTTHVTCGASYTSVAVDPQWAQTWVAYIVAKFGPSNGRRIYELDNEPALWNSTHHDVRPTPLGYDDLWQRMRDYAVAILAADPTALIAGPVEWGWPNYFCSAADDISQGCSATSPDRAQHGGEELVAWLLDQAKTYEAQNGKRILHYLDLHYYPQGGNPPEVTRSLWDPTYTDPSWINDQIQLVPRMRDWVTQHYPGTKTAVTEYDFYHHDEAVGAVTYAEVLGIFGREGLDAATAWAPPAPNQRAFAAYRLFANYDGAGSRFESTSVRADVSGSSSLKAYASAGATRLTVVLVNESGASQSAVVTFGNFAPGATAQVYRNDASGGTVSQQPDVTIASASASLTLPASSITLLAVDGTNPNNLPDAGVGAGGAAGSTGSGGTSGTSSGTGGAAGSGASLGTGGTAASGGTTASGGSGASPVDGGAAAAGRNAASASSSDEGGCGCRTDRNEAPNGAALVFAVMAAMAARRRASLRIAFTN